LTPSMRTNLRRCYQKKQQTVNKSIRKKRDHWSNNKTYLKGFQVFIVRFCWITHSLKIEKRNQHLMDMTTAISQHNIW